MMNSNSRRQRAAFSEVAMMILFTLTASVVFVAAAQSSCSAYNDQGQCISWTQSGGYSSYEEWKAWQVYWACVADANALNEDDDDTNDVDIDEECDRPEYSGGSTSARG